METIILNERKYAEDCLNDSCPDRFSAQTLSILARYFYHVKGCRKKKIYESLMSYMRDHNIITPENRVYWDSMAERQATNAHKYKLQEIDGIGITKAEVETIKGIKGVGRQRLAFVMLCLAKYENMRNPKNNSWVRWSPKDLFNMARVTCSADEREVNIGILYDSGLLGFSKRNDNLSCKVLFINEDSEQEWFISDMRELGYRWRLLNGDKSIKSCCECGLLMRVDGKSNKKVYCPNCEVPSPSAAGKLLTCIDCGEKFLASPKNNRAKRCPYCYRIYRREYKRLDMSVRRRS